MIELHWQEGQTQVSWAHDGTAVVKSYERPPATVTVWHNPPCVIVVEAVDGADRIDNAVVFEPDGTERLRLVPPRLDGDPSWNIGFYAVYADPHGLVAVFATRVGDFWGRPDLNTGELTSVAQWR